MPVCSGCNTEKNLAAKGLCSACYQRANEAACANCGRVGVIKGRGMCGRCHKRYLAYGDPNEASHAPVKGGECSYCGQSPIHAQGLCKTCYSRFLRNGTPGKVKVKRQVECWSCGRPRVHTALGLCSGCYTRYNKTGSPFLKVFENTKPCTHCGKRLQVAKGLCVPCYYRLQKMGTLEYKHKGKDRNLCTVEGCENIAVSRTFCGKHLMRVRRGGSTELSRPVCIQNPISALRLVWTSMHRRCEDPGVAGYKHYGGRGIGVCDRWDDFRAFMSDMGPKPSPGHSIDRINVNGNYEPSNCRWATATEQAQNKRNTVLSLEIAQVMRELYASGVSLREIATGLGLTYESVKSVVRQGAWKSPP
jgi:hypothetical protein